MPFVEQYCFLCIFKQRVFCLCIWVSEMEYFESNQRSYVFHMLFNPEMNELIHNVDVHIVTVCVSEFYCNNFVSIDKTCFNYSDAVDVILGPG